MKLVLYSGGAKATNKRLHGALADLVGTHKRKRSLTYVPFAARGADVFFQRFVRRYMPFGFHEFHCCPIDENYVPDAFDRALRSDAIYLAGGNTFYFLHHLRRRRLLGRLRAFGQEGGVLAGLSAGAIILTPNIGLAGYPPFDADRNDVGLTRLTALGLVPFEFFPHYHEGTRLRGALLDYSRRVRGPIVASADGGGVVVDGRRMTFIGRNEIFMAGAHGPLSLEK